MVRINWRTVLLVFLVIGMLDSAFLVYEHYSPTASKYCRFGQNVDCGIVNKSAYATLDGIFYLMVIDFKWPVPYLDLASKSPIFEFLLSNAVLGFFTLLLVVAMLLVHKKGKDFWFIKTEKILNWVIGILSFGILYGAYLFFIQHSILKTWCPFCLLLDTIMILSLIAAIMLKRGGQP